jgi:tripartite-type tricarboxylate transporter receptor subunit TctC
MLKAAHRAVALGFACLFGLHASAQAQDAAANYPNKAVRFIVAFAPGGGTDLLGRIAADHLSKSLGQPFVVENKPGAGGMIAARAVLAERPDGYTILVGGSTPMVFNPLVYSDLGYDRADLVAVTILGTYPMVIAGQLSVAKDMKELIQVAKQKGGHMTYGHPGAAAWRAMMEALNNAIGIRMTHVPYKGGGPAATAFLGGQTDLIVSDMTSVVPLHKSGKARVLAVTTKQRNSLFPEVPTVAESGIGLPDFEATAFAALGAHRQTPPAILRKLQQGVAQALAAPEVRKRLDSLGIRPEGISVEESQALIQAQITRYAPIVEASGMKAEK